MSKVRRGSKTHEEETESHWDGTWGSECRVIEGERKELGGRGTEAL